VRTAPSLTEANQAPRQAQSFGNLPLNDTPLLVKQAQAGDETAFTRLVQPHMRKAYHVALRITRNREDAEDASQQTFLKAFANISQFNGTSRFSTWLIRIAMNEALMIIRKRRSDDSHLSYDADLSGTIEEWSLPTPFSRRCFTRKEKTRESFEKRSPDCAGRCRL